MTEPNHTHPEHSCPACLAQENSTRVGYGNENPPELWPDYVPPPGTYRYAGGPLDGRRIHVGTRRPATWRTAEGCPCLNWTDHGFRYYRADHAARAYRAVS